MIDLAQLAALAKTSGVQWSYESEDLDCTVLSWRAGEGVAEHVNSEVDVWIVVLGGEGRLTLDGVESPLRNGEALMLPKGVPRGLVAITERFTYVNVHRRRKKLGLGGIEGYKGRVTPVE